jgi:hypothetical protein
MRAGWLQIETSAAEVEISSGFWENGVMTPDRHLHAQTPVAEAKSQVVSGKVCFAEQGVWYF